MDNLKLWEMAEAIEKHCLNHRAEKETCEGCTFFHPANEVYKAYCCLEGDFGPVDWHLQEEY